MASGFQLIFARSWAGMSTYSERVLSQRKTYRFSQMKGMNRPTIMFMRSESSDTSPRATLTLSRAAFTLGAPQVGRLSSMAWLSHLAPLLKRGVLVRSNSVLPRALGSTRLLSSLSSSLPVSFLRQRRRL